MLRPFASAATIALAIGGFAIAQPPSSDQIAEQFLPPAFTAYAASHTYLSENRSWNALPVDLDKTGRNDYLAIGYTNGRIGYLRVIRLGETPTLVGDSSTSVPCESTPFVEAVDIDGDGKPELNLRCRIGHAGAQFSSLFRWTGGGITPLNPANARREGAWTPIREANFVDLDGDGVLEILEASADSDVDDSGVLSQHYDVYQLLNGTLTKSTLHVAYFGEFVRGTGKPATVTETFASTPGAFVLTIANGERGVNIVDSAVVTLNGVTIEQPSAFSSRSRLIRTDVTLAAQNTLSVELRSAPDSLLHVVFVPKP